MDFKPTRSLRMLALGACALAMSPVAQADIYKYVDKYGRVYLTDKPDHGGYKLLVKTWKGWEEKRGVAKIDYEKNRKKFATHIANAAERYRLPTALLHAVITAESWYDPNAVSRAGAVGLMQLMPGTAERYGVANRRDPAANIDGGSRYLRDLLAMFDNNLTLALAGYNAGENAVIRNNYQIPPYEETQQYVRKVLRYYKDYSRAARAEKTSNTM